MKTGIIIRRILAALLVTAVVWCAVIFWWQSSGASPGIGDLVLWLLLVPVALVGGYWTWRWWRARKRAAAPAPATTPEEAELAETPPLPDRVLRLRGSALWLRAGASAADAAGSLVEPQRPGLHPDLRDAAGLPVYAAPVEDVDGKSMREVLLSVATEPEAIERLLHDEVLRAFALLQPVAEELLLAARPAPVAVAVVTDGLTGRDGLHPQAMAHSRSARAAAPAPGAAPLQLHALLPADWPTSLREFAADWLRAQAQALGYQAGQMEVGTLPAGGPLDTWRLLDQIAEAGHSSDTGRDATHLLLATQSSIGEASIERLDARSRLLSSGRNEGLIPGEGAAGLWLASTDAPGEPPAPRLHRAIAAKAATGAGHRAAVRRSSALLARAAETAALPMDAITALLSDADHRPSRSIEAAGACHGALPGLDPDTASLNLGVPCGELGAVAPLALIALAAHLAGRDDAPVLALAVGADEQRVALAASPPLPGASDSESTQAAAPATTPEPAATATA